MELQFLGTGGAFERTSTNYHNNGLLRIGGEKYLLDCSLLALESLDDLGVDPLDIDGVILTHMHGDHDSGLEELGFRGLFIGQGQTFDLYTHPRLLPSRTDADSDVDLWENRLKGGMMHVQGPDGSGKEATLETYFEPHPEEQFTIGGADFEFVPVEHVSGKDSFGIKIETDQHKTFYTADARPLFMDRPTLYTESDMIFHDCMFMDYYEATVHSHLEELLELPEHIQRKTYIMHYGDPGEWDERETGGLNIAAKHETFEI